MNLQETEDLKECKEMDERGEEKDCRSCSNNIFVTMCLARQRRPFTPKDYQLEALRTANGLEPNDLVLNGVLGLCGESGEVADIIKKHLFQGHELDKEKVVDELGDVCWYIAIMATGLGVSLETIMYKNIEKLKKRYPEGFDSDLSINREE